MRGASGETGFDWRGAVLLAVIAVALHVLMWVLLPFVLAAIVAFLCQPIVSGLTRRTAMPPWLAGAGVWLVLFAIGAGVAVAVGLSAVGDLSRLARRGPDLIQDILVQALGPNGVQVLGVHLRPQEIADEIKSHVGASLRLGPMARLGATAAAAGVGVFLFAALSFYLMVSGPEVGQGALWIVPPTQRAAVMQRLPQMAAALRRFYIGVLIIVVFTAMAAGLGYGVVLHVPDAALLALALGVLETVPAIGPVVSAAIVAVAALQLHSPAVMGFMVGYAIVLRLVIDDIVAPAVLGRSVTVHPVVVMLAYALGAVLFGVTGLLLAVPAAACARIWLESEYGDTPADVRDAMRPRRRPSASG